MADKKLEILTIESEADVTSGDKICGLCLKNTSKYTCPRCNTTYCTLSCYKSDKHRVCSEMFYKDCFMEGLKDCSVDPEEKRKLMDILSRAETDPDLDDLDLDDGDDLHERLDNLDLEKDTDQVWERLTEQEKREFEHMITDGRLGNLVEEWTPWWKEAVPVVMEMDSVKQDSSKPNIKSEIPKISELLRTKPSADVRYNLLNVLYSYAYICRLHNGDHVSMATDSAEDLINLSSVLGQGQNFESVRDSIQSCFSKLQSKNCGFDSNVEQNLSVLNDVLEIISCPIKDDPLRYILLAVSDLFQVFRTAYKSTTKHSVRKAETEKTGTHRKQLFQCKKKCEFLLSWGQSYGMCMLDLVPELNLEYSLIKSDVDLFNKSKSELEIKWGGHVKPKKRTLIEEL